MFDVQEALKAPRESLIYTVAIVPSKDREDYVLTIDTDPNSKTYSQVGPVFNFITFYPQLKYILGLPKFSVQLLLPKVTYYLVAYSYVNVLVSI